MKKLIDKSNVFVGVIALLFLILMLMQSISVSDVHNVTIKDFSIMRTAGLPKSSDVKECLGIFGKDFNNGFVFEKMFSAAYGIFIFSLISILLSLKKFYKALISKVILTLFSITSLLLLITDNSFSFILKTYDSLYYIKLTAIVIMSLITIFSMVSQINCIIKNGGFQKINIHAFYNSICVICSMLVILLMIIPFKYGDNSYASVLGVTLLPDNYKQTFIVYLEKQYDSVWINGIAFIPSVVFIFGLISSFLCIDSYKNSKPTICMLILSVVSLFGILFNPLMREDSKLVLYLLFSAVMLVCSVLNLVEYAKVQKALESHKENISKEEIDL